MYNRDNFYQNIAGNIRTVRKKLSISQSELAIRADISLDTVKSVENGRRSMSLDTYLSIVDALHTTPTALLCNDEPEQYTKRFAILMDNRDERQIEFALRLLEKILEEQDIYKVG